MRLATDDATAVLGRAFTFADVVTLVPAVIAFAARTAREPLLSPVGIGDGGGIFGLNKDSPRILGGASAPSIP